MNHITGEATKEKRNVLTESARIARGNVLDLEIIEVSKYDALFLPGALELQKIFLILP